MWDLLSKRGVEFRPERFSRQPVRRDWLLLAVKDEYLHLVPCLVSTTDKHLDRGVMGGYIQGGGHSPLSSIYGIAADHALSMEVVLASGEFVTASATQNSDLFWALRGGGGSTFGIVTSVIVKAHPDFPVTVTSFDFGGVNPTTSYNATWAGIRVFFTHFIDFSSAGTYSYFNVVPSPVPIFEMAPFFAPSMPIAQLPKPSSSHGSTLSPPSA